MTIVRRILVGYVVIMVQMVVMIVVGLALLVPLQSNFQKDNQGALDRADLAVELDHSAMVIGSYLSAVLTEENADDRAQYRGLLTDETDHARGLFESAMTLDQSAEGQEALAQMKTAFDGYVASVDSALALSITESAAALTVYNEEIVPVQSDIDREFSDYVATQRAGQDSAIESASRSLGYFLLVMLVIGSFILIAGLTVAVLIPRRVSHQLRQAAASIGTSASEMLAVASQVAAAATQTAASTSETTATVEEVKQTALLATEKASQVAENSQEVARVAENGRQAVEDTILGIEQMQGQMSLVAQTVNRLSEQTQAVGDIIATVSDLAEQSNLLSVNASIEAAKAGDAGRGFTVVAQEVKSLAAQSKLAVSQVRTILSEIQKAGSLVVEAAEQSRVAIESGRLQSLESGEAIHRLTESVSESAQSAVQIAASSRQQLAGMEQISQALDSINAAGGESAKGTRQVEHEVKQLQDLALRLRRLVDRAATA